MSRTHAPTLDDDGVPHGHGCPGGPWTTHGASLPGWALARCTTCGVSRLVRLTTATARGETPGATTRGEIPATATLQEDTMRSTTSTRPAGR